MLNQPRLVTLSLDKSAGLLRTANDYLSLVKPPIISLLLLTAVGGMFLAAEGVPSLTVLLLVCVGGALGSGGANALNHVLDQDIDRLMSRTSQRPVASQRISSLQALTFGILLNLLSFLLLAAWVNLLAAVLTMAATLFYVFVYTKWLKRTTPQNIVIGGAAGAIPPVIGWAGVTGGIDLSAFYLFAIIFFWTPPHFWALSLLIQGDYEKAGIPMLPVVAGRENTVQSIFYYSLVLIAITLVFAFTSSLNWVYLAAALLLGGMFVALARELRVSSTARNARRLYLFSLLYLALLFVAIMVDSVV